MSYFSFPASVPRRVNKGRGMCYPVCGMVYIKEPLLLIGKSSPCGGSGFPLSLSEWCFTICLLTYVIELFLVPASVPRRVTKAVVCAILSVGWCI